MKKFRNNITGEVATEEKMESYQRIAREWKEITPLFITEDGVYIFDMDTLMFGTKRIKGDFSDGSTVYKGYIVPVCGSTFHCAYTAGEWKWFSTPWARTKWIDEQQKVVLTTDDGVEIYEGQEVWYVNDAFDIVHHDNSKPPYPKYIIFAADCRASGGKYFSTKRKAQDYVDRNKTLLITEDNVHLTKFDIFWFTNKKFQVGKSKISTPSFKLFDDLKAFSSKEAAENYVFQNEPAFSRLQIDKAIERAGGPATGFIKTIIHDFLVTFLEELKKS